MEYNKKILKIIIISCTLFGLLLSFVHVSNLICSNMKIKDMLFVEGILLTLIGIASLFDGNGSNVFTKKYFKVTSSNLSKNKENFKIDYQIEPTLDTHIIAGVFILTGFLATIFSCSV